MDLHPHGALPSLFTRAFHSRPTQPTPSDLLEQTSILSRLLPMQHPLLVHRTDYHIHHSTPQTPGGAGGGPGGNLQGNASATSAVVPHVAAPNSTSGVNIGGWGNESDPQQTESAMQQLLTNISTATGSSELLGFGVGGSTSSGAQRARSPPQGNSASTSGSGNSSNSQQQQIIDDGLESPTIPSTFTRWEEESAAIDGHMPILVMRTLREDILQHWMDEYEKENAPKEDQNKTTSTASASGSTSASSVAGGGEQSGTTSSSTTAAVGGASGAGGQSTQGEGSSSTGAMVGDSTPGTITVPNPSDEATPSSHSPRDGSSVVDQLRSGLRQVADALAQTVAAVRSTRDQLQLTQRRDETSTGKGVGSRSSVIYLF